MPLIRLACTAALPLACGLASAQVAAPVAPSAPSVAASGAGRGAAETLAPAPAPAPAPASASTTSPLQRSGALPAAPRGDAARRLPIVLMSKTFSTLPDLWMLAEGEVEFRRGSLVVRADRLAYDVPTDRAKAQGHVRIEQPGVVYSGPELDLNVQRFEGSFQSPRFEFSKLKSGGRAARVDFLGPNLARAINASYTSCPREDIDGGTELEGRESRDAGQAGNPRSSTPEPAWVLKADRVDLNLESNVGVAEGAVLRFLGHSIIALPTLSFPLGDTRKSGWLPPTANLDNRSGVDLTVPYYWDIAPNRDATLAPRLITRRGVGLDAEFRYLEPSYEGQLRMDLLPHDRLAGRSRGSLRWTQEGRLPWGIQARADVARVSDDEWWRDFPSRGLSITPRLLAQRLTLERPFDLAQQGASVLTPTGSQGLAYARVLRWQALQATDAAVVSPFERNPQLGLRWRGGVSGWLLGVETEYNRFTLPSEALARAGRNSGGERLHAQAQLSYPWREPGWWVTPKFTLNGAAYAPSSTAPGAVGRASRTLPTFSLDSGLELERYTEAFGRALRQTLEPRLLYVNTPFRAQSQLPNYDAAAKDFNFVSIYSENTFSGVDRISDTHQISAGFTTRLVDEATGAEALRLGLVQRYQLRSQFVAPQADGSPDGPALTQRLSDLLLLGSTSVLPHWNFDAAVQYNPDLQRSVRTIVGVRHSPGPFRTVNTTYRFARGVSEQVELGWQWPLLERTLKSNGLGSGADGCQGSWYSVGRVNYSLKDSRITDSILGLEYDAGCWVGRLVAERLSTGRSAATTRLSFQMELIGLSRLGFGFNPLKVLKDNIPGYRLLREDRSDERLNDRP